MSNDQDSDVLDVADGDDSGFEDFDTGGDSLSGSIKTNPVFKIGIIVAAMTVIAGGIMLFGGKKDPVSMSMVKQGSDVTQVAGTDTVSEVYANAVKDKDEQALEDAVRQGGSVMPVPIGPPKTLVPIEKQESSSEDPLERWRRIQEERLRKEQLQPAPGQVLPQQAVAAVDPYAEQKSALAGALAAQMQSILEGTKLKPMQTRQVTSRDWLDQKLAREAELQEKAVQQQILADATQQPTVEILLEAGRIEYAQLITEANTDSPGPVLATIASGPLAGSRAIGTFNATDEYITLTFNAVIVDGKALPTNAIALDPATSKPGLITEIDQKYFKRVILPAAAAFVEGIGGAIADSGSTTVSAGTGTTTSSESDLDARQEFFKGVQEASSKIGEILDESGQSSQPMLRVAAGTHLGLLFVQPVERPIPPPAVLLRDQGVDRAAQGAVVQPVPATQVETSGMPTSQ